MSHATVPPIRSLLFAGRSHSMLYTCNLPAPASFSGTSVGSGQAALDWSGVFGAYQYQVKTYDLDEGLLVGSQTVSGTNTVVSGLQQGKTYRFELAAVCTGNRVSSNTIIIDIVLN